MPIRIACIVEGHGEVASVPLLIRRIALTVDPAISVHVHTIRVAKSKLLKAGELERAVRLAGMRAAPNGGLLLLLDSDDDCPAQLGPALAARLHTSRSDLPCVVVLANREFECWFVAAAASFGIEAPPDPEAIRGAKEGIELHTPAGVYSPSTDQPSYTAQFDMDQARRAPSFDRCYRKVTALLETLRSR
jgi:hypothetical protein